MSFPARGSKRRLRWAGVLNVLALVCLLAGGSGEPARASVSLLLEQPYGGLGRVNPMGHSALYFDHICAASPTELRPCRPGELGAVVSRYDGIHDYDWLAVPLVPYLYAVESPAEIPDWMTHADVARVRDEYRRRWLQAVAPNLPDGSSPGGNWYELVGSAYDRTIYGFTVDTTAEQEARLIALFNDRRNRQRYNGLFRNCADFARVTINRLYPHAVRRNFVADFGFTTPKSVARGLSHYAEKHPEVHLRQFVIPQVEGTLPRSHEVQGITEGLIKRYGVPLVVLSPIATGVVFVAYMGHGRLDMPRDAPVLDLREQAMALTTGAAGPPAAGRRTEAPGADATASFVWPLLAAPVAAPVEPEVTVPALLSSPVPGDVRMDSSSE
ncbi:MAG TPA: hypothetical protein VM865_05780 [Acidobacteriaceae bacterium]|nr:hypothetical protein [Acidobacteriaceae bacterium]